MQVTWLLFQLPVRARGLLLEGLHRRRQTTGEAEVSSLLQRRRSTAVEVSVLQERILCPKVCRQKGSRCPLRLCR